MQWGASEGEKDACTSRKVMPDFAGVCSTKLDKSLHKLVFDVDCHSQQHFKGGGEGGGGGAN